MSHMILTPSSCHKMLHFPGPTLPWSMMYFMDGYYDLMDYLQLPSMMLQELPPWLNLCMLLRLGGVLPGLSTGHASTVSSVEHAEWGTSLVRPQKLQSWLVTLKMACWLPLLHVQPTFYDQFFYL